MQSCSCRSVPEEESALVHTSPEDSGEGDDDEGDNNFAMFDVED